MKTKNRKTKRQIQADCTLTKKDVALLLSSDGSEVDIDFGNVIGHLDVQGSDVLVTYNDVTVNFNSVLDQAIGSVMYGYGEAMMSEEQCFDFLRDVVESLRNDVE